MPAVEVVPVVGQVYLPLIARAAPGDLHLGR